MLGGLHQRMMGNDQAGAQQGTFLKRIPSWATGESPFRLAVPQLALSYRGGAGANQPEEKHSPTKKLARADGCVPALPNKNSLTV